MILMSGGEFTFIMDEMKYLNKTVLDSKIDMLAESGQYEIYFQGKLFFYK